jgi:hypothetical protein
MTEPARPEPDFHAVIMRDEMAVIDVTHAVMDAYDIAVNSLDFGSGFLSTEEVANLRALGKAIGAEPLHYQCNGWTKPDGTVVPCDCGAETS